MPELPEVETVCNGIRPYLEAASIVSSKVLNAKLRINIPANFTKLIKGKQILQVKRKAKYILIYLRHCEEPRRGDVAISMRNEIATSSASQSPRDDVIIIHLGMSGRLTISDKQYLPKKHDQAPSNIQCLI